MITTIEIITVEMKQRQVNGKDAPFMRADTSAGWVSVFDKPLMEKINQNIGNCVSVELIENEKGFKNIRGFYEVVSGQAQVTTENVTNNPELGDKYKAARDSKDQSIENSICLKGRFKIWGDIFAAYMIDNNGSPVRTNEDIMKEAIALVEQARRGAVE